MTWYVWVFDGIGAAIAVPLIGWVITRFQRKRSPLSADDAGQSKTQQPAINSSAPPSTSGPSHPPDAPRRPPVQVQPSHIDQVQPSSTDLVDLILSIPGMTDPAFRQRLYEHLPHDVAQQLHLDSRAARPELIGLIDTFAEYPHLSPWRALIGRLQQLQPAHQGVQLLALELERHGLI